MSTTTTRGVAILKFGTYTVSGHIVNEATVSRSGQKFVLDNESGQNVTHVSNFGLEGTMALTFVPLAATTQVPDIDGVITYNGQSGVIENVEDITVKRQPRTWRLTCTFIPGITYGS